MRPRCEQIHVRSVRIAGNQGRSGIVTAPLSRVQAGDHGWASIVCNGEQFVGNSAYCLLPTAYLEYSCPNALASITAMKIAPAPTIAASRVRAMLSRPARHKT